MNRFHLAILLQILFFLLTIQQIQRGPNDLPMKTKFSWMGPIGENCH